MLGTAVQDAAVEAVNRGHLEVRGKTQGHRRKPWRGAHGRDIAEVDGQGLPAHLLPGGHVTLEVDSLYEGVCGQDLRRCLGLPCGGVIADAQEEVRRTTGDAGSRRGPVPAYQAGYALDKTELSQVTHPHAGHYTVLRLASSECGPSLGV